VIGNLQSFGGYTFSFWLPQIMKARGVEHWFGLSSTASLRLRQNPCHLSMSCDSVFCSLEGRGSERRVETRKSNS